MKIKKKYLDSIQSTYAAVWAGIVSVWMTVILTVVSELSVSFKQWLAGLTGHHWVSKSWLVLLMFVVVWRVSMRFSAKPSGKQLARMVDWLSVSLILGGGVIIGFYMLHYWGTY